MSRIDDLIDEYCPEGVEFKRLGDIVRIKNGKDHKSLGDGEFPVYGSGGIMRYADTYAYNKPSVLIPRKGSLGNLFFVDVPFWTVDTIFYTEIDEAQVNPKYLYYFLTTVGLGEMNQAGGVPSQTQSVLNELKIPIPCPDNPEKSLAIQAEIVRILDAFTAMTAELTAELNLRKKQYNYYRDKLLSFEEGEVERKALGKLAENLDSQRKPITSGFREAGDIPYYGASGIVDYVKGFIFDGDFLLVSEDGANLLARNTPIAFSVSGKTWVNNHAHVLKFDTYAERKYVEYYLNSIDLTPYISGAAQPKLNKKNLESIRIPNPSPEEKERIVAILDKFDTLTTSIQEGLPREIELRQKQYEYYRDLLLSFPKSNEGAA
ncbi:restriction endonuclease subunit S [Vibrio vulnificus]|uniref:restriction endonuclease subunit S n=1 Tax=Vibrio vulnificus TaxID=672 RepID=UPI0040596EF6